MLQALTIASFVCVFSRQNISSNTADPNTHTTYDITDHVTIM